VIWIVGFTGYKVIRDEGYINDFLWFFFVMKDIRVRKDMVCGG
jgi:hypothetical protein